jgi:SAM-dependent methyltransferase
LDATGLAATTWDDFAGDEPWWDHHVFSRVIERNPGRSLDVGCGTGRLLLPYLASGIDIEGVDSSEEMLAICRGKAAGLGLTPVLYRQRMQALELPGRYSTIIVPGGSFHLIVDREEAIETLARFRGHLEPDGILGLSLDDPRSELTEGLPGRWRPWGKVIRSPDGAEVRQHKIVESVNRVEQTTTTVIRYRVLRDGKVVDEEHHKMEMRLYFQ